MNRHNTALLILIFVLTGIGWLAFQRFSNIAYMTSNYEAITGWPAIAASWPIYFFILTLAALVGLFLGDWLGHRSRDNDVQEIKQSLQNQILKAQAAEQKARETLAAAEQARRDAEAHLPKIADLAEANAILGARLKGAVEGLEERKDQVRKKRKELNKANSEIEKWQNAYANANRDRDRVVSDFGEPQFDD